MSGFVTLSQPYPCLCGRILGLGNIHCARQLPTLQVFRCVFYPPKMMPLLRDSMTEGNQHCHVLQGWCTVQDVSNSCYLCYMLVCQFLMVQCFLTGCVNSDFNNLSLQQENNLLHYPGYLLDPLHFQKIEDVHVILEVAQEGSN